jgi:outer membrane protein assembly factor BamB
MPGEKELLILETETGKAIARKAVSASQLWHPPVLASGVVLLTDSLGGNVFGFDVRTGQDRFTFALGAPPISPLTVPAGRDAAFMHTLRDGAVHVTVLDLKRLRVRFSVALRANEHVIDALSVPPLAWKDRLLYRDASSGAVLTLNVNTGRVEVLAPEGVESAATPNGRTSFRWSLCGDTLCIVGSEGEVRLWRLSAGE